MREFVNLGAAEVVLVERAAGERAGPAAALEAEAVVEERLAILFAAEGPESAAATERDWEKTKMPDDRRCSKDHIDYLVGQSTDHGEKRILASGMSA